MANSKKVRKQIQAAVDGYNDHPGALRRLTRQFRDKDTLQACRQSAKQLLLLNENSREALASLIFCAVVAKKIKTIQTSLQQTQQATQADATAFADILRKARKNLTKSDRGLLKQQLKIHRKADEPQRLYKQIESAHQRHAQDPEPLRQLTRKLRHHDTAKACLRSAKRLLQREKKSADAIASLLFCYSREKNASPNLRNIFDLAHQKSRKKPDQTEQILNAARTSLNEEERIRFEQHLCNYRNEAELIARRRNINLEASDRLKQRPRSKSNSCDVICLASNEAPYIAEFIHHYLYQGFSNLFIGLNNDSSGRTGPIIKAIAKVHPNVHLINTDQEHQTGEQRSSYSRLHHEASVQTRSTHCMVVDVDEYWVSDPFRNKISDFLSVHADADVLSSFWVHCRGGLLFGNPLDLANTRLAVSGQFKSLFRYGIPVTDLGAHVPWVLNKPSCRHISSDGRKVPTSRSWDGVRRLKKRGALNGIGKAGTGWVIHRHTRSELEYASKLLYPDVNKLDKPFKANRDGYQFKEENQRARELAHSLFGSTAQPPEDYLNSLEAFIQRCGLVDDLSEARALISEAELISRIEAISADDVRAHRDIWKRTFRGTRFLPMLEARLP